MKINTKARSIFFAVIVVIAALFIATFAFPAARAEGSDGMQRATLVYSDAQKTVVTGIDDTTDGFDPQEEYEVYIPSTVKSIAFGAFIGRDKLVSVSFDANIELTDIGDFAFGGTGIASVKLPEDLKTVGAAAFADCKNLKSVELPDSLESIGKRAFGNNGALSVKLPDSDKVVYGEAAFDKGNVNLVAADKASYEKIVESEALKDYVDTDLTYTVMIEYDFLGSVIDTEQRLFGKDYKFVFQNGEWITNPDEKLGTAVTGDMKWHASKDVSSAVLQESDVTALLNDPETGDVITLYAWESTGDKIFVARNNIVYEEGKEYAMTDLNALLYNVSDKITPSMTVTIEAYTDADGNAVQKTDDAFPETVGKAGHYSLKVVDGAKEYEFNIDIARKVVDLGDYTSSLAWRLYSVGAQTVNSELLSSSGTMLYIYTRLADGSEYPSYTVLSDNEIDDRELDSEYVIRNVRYSIARYRGEDTKLTVALKSNPAYTPDNYSNNVADKIGRYNASVSLTANDNYLLALDRTPVNGAERGIEIVVSKDGKTATVTKAWYVVDVGNWIVGADNGDYTIADRVYGDTLAVDVPRVMYGDVADIDYGSANDPVSLSLVRNGETIIGNESFTRARFAYYINNAMPAGDYRLRVTVRSVITEEYAETDTEHLNPMYVYHSGFEETIAFTVAKKEMPTDITEKIDSVLKYRTFDYLWDGTAHYYDDSAAQTVNTALGYVSSIDRSNTVWENSQYDDLFGGFEIVFNLSRMQHDVYYTAATMPITPVNPDKYTVFYKVVAPNYRDSVADLDDGELRTDYYFEVINVREIDIPVTSSKTYTGELLTADLADTLIYEITENKGGINAGEYDVTVSFREPDFYMWKGQTLDDKTAAYTVKFRVTTATNRWEVDPGVTFWVEGGYDDVENAVFGTARFGTVAIVITDSSDNIIYSTVNNINKLASAKAGVYRLSATVAATGNYDLLTYSAFVQVFEKPGLPWWAILLIVVGALLIAALIILILWKKGVFQILTGKIVLAIRTRATVDATIAAVRANKVAIAARASVAEAEKRDAAEERAKARKEAAEAERNKTAEERASELTAKAQAESERADRIKARAEEMLTKAEAIKESAATTESVAEPEKPQPKKKSSKKKSPVEDNTPSDAAPTEPDTTEN